MAIDFNAFMSALRDAGVNDFRFSTDVDAGTVEFDDYLDPPMDPAQRTLIEQVLEAQNSVAAQAAAARTVLKAGAQNEYERRLAAGAPYHGSTLRLDPASEVRILGKTMRYCVLNLPIEPDFPGWVLSDGKTVVPVSAPDDMKAIAVDADAFATSAFKVLMAHWTAIDATPDAQVSAYDVKANWPW